MQAFSIKLKMIPNGPWQTRAIVIGHRCGVTLMETIFAIGVIMTGLLGLAALIPVASQNAQATMEMDRSISESTSAAAAGLARSFNDLDRLVIMDKASPGSIGSFAPPPPTPFHGYAPTRNLQTVSRKLALPDSRGKLETPAYRHHPEQSGLKAALCLDPLGVPELSLIDVPTTSGFFVDNVNLTPQFVNPVNADTVYDYSRFPYYSERYRVLTPPNASIGGVGVAPNWPMSPRMWRCTLRSEMSPSVVNVRPWHIISTARARQLFQGFGGLVTLTHSEDQALRGVLIDRTTIGNRFVDAATSLASEYSWFATLAPPFAGDNPFRQSIVVVRQRELSVPQRDNDPAALSKNSYDIADAKDNPSGERLTWVGESIGFQGGVGGDVLLYGSEAINDEMNAGEWVMLSRQPHLLGPPVVPTGTAVFRWYRVVRVDEPESGLVNNDFEWFGPASATPVWRRWVTLAGPDWIFQDGVVDQRDDTFCTIVTGAVSVIESEVVLQ